MGERRFPCARCGALLAYVPGTCSMRCSYCAHEQPIPESADTVDEHDFHAQLAELGQREPVDETLVIKCSACAAEITAPDNVTAISCPFCSADIVATAKSRKAIRPRALLPFAINRDQAQTAFRKWLGRLWFAPGDLKRFARLDSRVRGVYTPCWTFDCVADTTYTGQRGDDYWTTQMQTVMVNGKPTVRPVQVKQTRWRSASGQVRNTFDDLLVVASRSLPREQAEKLEPWDLHELIPYQDEYLSGFEAESYQIGLEDGFGVAQSLATPRIEATIRSDIGGDHQRIHSMTPRWSAITFKHVLLPVWVSAYRHKGKVHRFVVNARTGEVQGERPWSWWRIAGAILAALIVIGVTALLIAYFKS